MKHVFYCDGNPKRISWAIQTDKKIIKQSRDHADIYLNRISDIQSKFVALHVGIFWGIGVFIIKNEDEIKVRIDDSKMIQYLTSRKQISDRLISDKMFFLDKLIEQRKLDVHYELINPEQNISKKLLYAKELKTDNDL